MCGLKLLQGSGKLSVFIVHVIACLIRVDLILNLKVCKSSIQCSTSICQEANFDESKFTDGLSSCKVVLDLSMSNDVAKLKGIYRSEKEC